MSAQSLIAKGNLLLAWRRINTSTNAQYKAFFRPVYSSYELGLETNLALLHASLQGSWKPRKPTRVYVPKPSGLQRPITLLDIEDQIVLQAIANVFANKLRDRRRPVELSRVFSSILTQPRTAVFFTHNWRRTYSRFQDTCRRLYRAGYRWILDFDLAAFYDTISHDRLLEVAFPRGGAAALRRRLSSWLECWSTPTGSSSIGHGIPQGPAASDFLAECFLLPLDLSLARQRIRLVRYVDDIRVFARSREAAQTAAIALEVQCKAAGLIPQSTKVAIRALASEEDASGSLPSLEPSERSGKGARLPMTRGRAERQLRSALDHRPLVIRDKARLRYVLFRAPKSPRILGWVLMLLTRHPEQIDAFASYLKIYSRNRRIDRVLAATLRAGMPYEYVRGELWKVLAQVASRRTLARLSRLARAELRRPVPSVALQWGVSAFLLRCRTEGLATAHFSLLHRHPLVQALLLDSALTGGRTDRGILRAALASLSPYPALAAARGVVKVGTSHLALGVLASDIHPLARNALRACKVLRGSRTPKIDQVGVILERRYGLSRTTGWRTVLGPNYSHALQILVEADELFEMNRSDWLRSQNAFNEAACRGFIAHRQRNGGLATIGLIQSDGRLAKFGNLVQSGGLLEQAYPRIAVGFRDANSRRNKLPESHPFDEKTGARNRYLPAFEQRVLRAKIGTSLEAILQAL